MNMNKAKFNYLIDFLLFISFLITMFSGLIVFIFLPGGFPQAGQQVFFDISRRSWIDIHHTAGISTIILIFMHLILHWGWVSQMTKSLFKSDQKTETH